MLGLRSCVRGFFLSSCGKSGLPSSWSRLLPTCGGFSCCGVRARWLWLLGFGAQARGLWCAALAALPCVESSRIRCLPVSPALAGGFSITEPPGKLPFCSFLLSRLPLLHMLLILLCVFSFIDTHSSKLTRHSVSGVCAWCCSLRRFGGPSRTGFYPRPPNPHHHGTSRSYDPAILLPGVRLSPLRLL